MFCFDPNLNPWLITLSLYHFITFKIYLLITLSLFQVQQWIFHHPCTIVQCPWSIPSSFYHCPLSMVHSNILPPLTNLHCPFQHPSTIVCGPLHCPMSMIHSSRSFCFEFRKWTENNYHSYLLNTVTESSRTVNWNSQFCKCQRFLTFLEESVTIRNLWHLQSWEFQLTVLEDSVTIRNLWHLQNWEFQLTVLEDSVTLFKR